MGKKALRVRSRPGERAGLWVIKWKVSGNSPILKSCWWGVALVCCLELLSPIAFCQKGKLSVVQCEKVVGLWRWEHLIRRIPTAHSKFRGKSWVTADVRSSDTLFHACLSAQGPWQNPQAMDVCLTKGPSDWFSHLQIQCINIHSASKQTLLFVESACVRLESTLQRK